MIIQDFSHAMHRTLRMNKEQVIQNYDFLSHLLLSQVTSFISKLGASKHNKFVIAVDSTSWRKDYYAQNKQQFPEMREMTYKGNRVKDTDIDWTKVYNICNDICDVLKKYSDIYVVKVDGAEADDIIAVLTQEFKSKENIWIASGDKDFIQLQDHPVVSIYDPLKHAFKPEQNVEMFKKIHTIIGDKSDNIPAIKPRVQEKTALKMLKDLDTLLATNPTMKAKYEFNEHLILFEHIPVDIREKIIEEYNNQCYSYNGMKLLGEFSRLKLNKFSEDINKFKLVDFEVKTKLNQFFVQKQKDKDMAERSLEDFFS